MADIDLVCPESVVVCLPVVASHNRTVLSALAVASVFSIGRIYHGIDEIRVSSQCGLMLSVGTPQLHCAVRIPSRDRFPIGRIHYGMDTICGSSQCFFMLPRGRIPQPHCAITTPQPRWFSHPANTPTAINKRRVSF